MTREQLIELRWLIKGYIEENEDRKRANAEEIIQEADALIKEKESTE